MDFMPISTLPTIERPIVRVNGRLLTSEPLELNEPTYLPASNCNVLYVPILALTPTILTQAQWKVWAVKGIDFVLWLCHVTESILYATLTVIGGLILIRVILKHPSKKEESE